MKKENKKIVYSSGKEERVDVFLSQEFSCSRSLVQERIKQKKILVNSKVIKASYKLQTQDEIYVEDLSPKEEIKLIKQDIPLEVIFEDQDIIVVNKAAGIVTHPSIGHESGSVVNALLDKLPQEEGLRPGVVHRLDKDTRGLLVLAKNLKAKEALALQFKNKTAGRTYLALCFGRFKNLSGTFKSHLSRHPKNRLKFSSQNEGKEAITHYKVLHNDEISLVELKLDTGRTHQIRVHLSESQHPILKDALYGNPKRILEVQNMDYKSKIKKIPSMSLVALQLDLDHPARGERMSFKIPIPEEFENFYE